MGNLRQNRVSATLTAAVKTAVKNDIKQINSSLSFLVGITPLERQRLMKLKRSNKLFVEEVIQTANQRPELIPPIIEVNELMKDMNLHADLTEFELLLEDLLNRVRDTKVVLGNEAMVSSLGVFHVVKLAAAGGVEGVQSHYNKLSERWEATFTSEDEVDDSTEVIASDQDAT
jgi:hypothetical protein